MWESVGVCGLVSTCVFWGEGVGAQVFNPMSTHQCKLTWVHGNRGYSLYVHTKIYIASLTQVNWEQDEAGHNYEESPTVLSLDLRHFSKDKNCKEWKAMRYCTRLEFMILFPWKIVSQSFFERWEWLPLTGQWKEGVEPHYYLLNLCLPHDQRTELGKGSTEHSACLEYKGKGKQRSTMSLPSIMSPPMLSQI